MQVHDELVFEVPQEELETVKALVLKAMELGQPLSVPLEVDINCGTSWKEG
jgi:DNA polymerase-1